jgi:hypothetical protein
MFEEALDQADQQDQAPAQEGQWGDTRDQAQPQGQDGQWGDTRGPEPTGANPVTVNPNAAAAAKLEQGPEIRMPQVPTTVGEAAKDTGDILQRTAEGFGSGMVKDFTDAIAGTDPDAHNRAKEHVANFLLFLRNDPQRAWEELGKSGQSMTDIGRRIAEGDWSGALKATSGAVYHGAAGVPYFGGAMKGITDEIASGHYKEGAADAFTFLTQFLHPETGEKQLMAAPEVGLKMGRDPAALEAQQYIMSKGAPANAAAATASPYVKAVQKGVEMTPVAAYTSEGSHMRAAEVVGNIAEELKKRNAATAQVPESAGAGTRSALESKIGMAHDAANAEYGEFRRMQADPANVKNVQVGSQTIDTGLLDPQGNKITRVQPIMEKIGLPADIGPLMDKLKPIYDDIREWMPIARQQTSPGFTVLSNIVNSGKTVISAAKAEAALGAIKELARESPEGRGQGLAKYVIPQLEDVVRNATDIPLDVAGYKANLQPALQALQRRLSPQQLQALPGIRDLTAFLRGPDQLRASQVKAALQNMGSLAGEDPALGRALNQATKDVLAKDPAGALERGRAATAAKYATKDVLNQLRDEPVQAFNQMTYANDAGIDFLRSVAKEVPGEPRKIGRAYLEKLFDQGPAKAFASWGNLGPSTKKILFDPALTPEIDKLVRAARDNAANPNPSGTAVVLGATAGLGGIILHPLATAPTIVGGAALSKLLRSPLGVRLLTEGMTVPIHMPRAAVIINALRRIAGTEIGPRAEETAGNKDETHWKYATGGKVHYDDGGDVDDGSDDPVLRDIERRRMIQLSQNPGQFWQQPITINPEQSAQNVFGNDYQAPPRKPMGPPQAPQAAPPVNDIPRDTSFTEAMSHADVRPEWMQQAQAAVDQPFSMPVTGGAPMDVADLVQLPQSKTEAGLLAAGALIPGGKVLKGAKNAVRLGTTLAEGAAPEVGLLGKALANVPRSEITAKEVLQAAKAGPGKFGSYSKYMERNPTAGAELFDSSNPQPAFPNRPPIARYDPSVGRGRGPSARIVDAFNNPKVIEGLKDYARQGAEQLPADWYANSPLMNVYEREWGPQAEEKFYQQMGQQAATSTGSAVPDNLRTGSYYNYLQEQGLPFPKKPAKGYGSKYQVAHRDTALNFRDTGTVDPIANPKRASFTENLMGNEDLLTGDKHFMRLVGILSEDPRFLKTTAMVSRNGKEVKVKPQELFQRGKLTMEQAKADPNLWVEAPNPNEYLHMENQYREKVAKPLGYSVANTQGKDWIGGGELTGLGSPPEAWIELLKHRIQYTADRLNVDPQVILRKFVRGEIPLLELGAAATGLGALMGQGQGADQVSDIDRTRTGARPAGLQ